MSFIKPVAAYNAATTVEAHFVCNLLNEAEIQAVVIEDVSQVGTWLGGLIPEIHKPQVWIEESDSERARPILNEYERHLRERQAGEPTDGLIEVNCEECGILCSFPASQKGSVQDCPHCHAFVDVGDDEGDMDWNEGVEEEPEGDNG